MEKYLELKITLQKELKRIKSHSRTYKCLIPECPNSAKTTSHVIQQSVILESILDDTGHFYTMKQNDLFKMGEEGPLKFERSSLSNSFKFPLYCKAHDDEIFAPIEKSHPINWDERKNALLQTYRTICMELRKKEIYIDIIKSIAENRKAILETLDYFDLRPAELSIKDMSYFKAEIETEIFHSDTARFTIATKNFKRMDICFSSALSIHDPNNPKTHKYDAWGYTKEEPLTSTFLNFFPYFDQSILIAVQHVDYPCAWTENLVERIGINENYEKTLSDLLTYRTEEWGISTDLYNNLSEEKKSQFIEESERHTDYFEDDLDTDFNLFENEKTTPNNG